MNSSQIHDGTIQMEAVRPQGFPFTQTTSTVSRSSYTQRETSGNQAYVTPMTRPEDSRKFAENLLETIRTEHMYPIPSTWPLSRDDPQKPVSQASQDASVGKLFACGLCEGLFVTPLRLKKHMLTHEGGHLTTQKLTNLKRSHTCHICQKQFLSQHSLNQHKQRHLVNKQFSCVVCQKKFRCESDLKRHQLKHIGEKSLTCWLCKETFTSPGSLKRHRLLHLSEHMFCPQLYREKVTGGRQVKEPKQSQTGGKLRSKILKKRMTTEDRYSIPLDGPVSRDCTTNQNTQTSEVREDETQLKQKGDGVKKHKPHITVLAETPINGGQDPQCELSVAMTTTSEIQGDTTGTEASHLYEIPTTEAGQNENNQSDLRPVRLMSRDNTDNGLNPSDDAWRDKGQRDSNEDIGGIADAEHHHLENTVSAERRKVGLGPQCQASVTKNTISEILDDATETEAPESCVHPMAGEKETENNSEITNKDNLSSQSVTPPQTSKIMTTTLGIKGDTTGTQATDLSATPMAGDVETENNYPETTSEDDLSSQSITSPQQSVTMTTTSESQGDTARTEVLGLSAIPVTEAVKNDNIISGAFLGRISTDHMYTIPSLRPVSRGDPVSRDDPHKSVSQARRDNSDGGTSVGKLFACGLCEGLFVTPLRLGKHMLTHEGGNLTTQKLTILRRSHTCQICQKQFLSQHSLNQHKQRHLVNKQFSCVVCQKKFRCKSDLKRHQLKHIGEKSLTCWLCKETFTSPGSLKRHRLLHLSEHMFCPQLYREKVTGGRQTKEPKQSGGKLRSKHLKKRMTTEDRYSKPLDGPVSRNCTTNPNTQTSEIREDETQLKLSGDGVKEHNPHNTVLAETPINGGLEPRYQISVAMTNSSERQGDTTGTEASHLYAIPTTEAGQNENNQSDLRPVHLISRDATDNGLNPSDDAWGDKGQRDSNEDIAGITDTEHHHLENTVSAERRKVGLGPQCQASGTKNTSGILDSTTETQAPDLYVDPMTGDKKTENNSETTNKDNLGSRSVTSPQTSVTMTTTSGIQRDTTGTQATDLCAIPIAGDVERENNNSETTGEDDLNSQSIPSPQASVTTNEDELNSRSITSPETLIIVTTRSEIQDGTSGSEASGLSVVSMARAVQSENINSGAFLGRISTDHMYTIPSVLSVSRGDPGSRDEPKKPVGQPRQDNSDGGTSVGKLFACGQCEGLFVTPLRLKKHMLTHEGGHLTTQKLTNLKRSHTCHICQKQFLSQYTLNQHKQRHMVNKKFSCVVCQKRFRRESDLKRHQLKHIGEKSLICWLCKETFTSPGSLKRHRLIHMSEHIFCPQLYRKTVTGSRRVKKRKPAHTGGKLGSKSPKKRIITEHRYSVPLDRSVSRDCTANQIAQSSEVRGNDTELKLTGDGEVNSGKEHNPHNTVLAAGTGMEYIETQGQISVTMAATSGIQDRTTGTQASERSAIPITEDDQSENNNSGVCLEITKSARMYSDHTNHGPSPSNEVLTDEGQLIPHEDGGRGSDTENCQHNSFGAERKQDEESQCKTPVTMTTTSGAQGATQPSKLCAVPTTHCEQSQLCLEMTKSDPMCNIGIHSARPTPRDDTDNDINPSDEVFSDKGQLKPRGDVAGNSGTGPNSLDTERSKKVVGPQCQTSVTMTTTPEIGSDTTGTEASRLCAIPRTEGEKSENSNSGVCLERIKTDHMYHLGLRPVRPMSGDDTDNDLNTSDDVWRDRRQLEPHGVDGGRTDTERHLDNTVSAERRKGSQESQCQTSVTITTMSEIQGDSTGIHSSGLCAIPMTEAVQSENDNWGFCLEKIKTDHMYNIGLRPVRPISSDNTDNELNLSDGVLSDKGQLKRHREFGGNTDTELNLQDTASAERRMDGLGPECQTSVSMTVTPEIQKETMMTQTSNLCAVPMTEVEQSESNNFETTGEDDVSSQSIMSPQTSVTMPITSEVQDGTIGSEASRLCTIPTTQGEKSENNNSGVCLERKKLDHMYNIGLRPVRPMSRDETDNDLNTSDDVWSNKGQKNLHGDVGGITDTEHHFENTFSAERRKVDLGPQCQSSVTKNTISGILDDTTETQVPDLCVNPMAVERDRENNHSETTNKDVLSSQSVTSPQSSVIMTTTSGIQGEATGTQASDLCVIPMAGDEERENSFETTSEDDLSSQSFTLPQTSVTINTVSEILDDATETQAPDLCVDPMAGDKERENNNSETTSEDNLSSQSFTTPQTSVTMATTSEMRRDTARTLASELSAITMTQAVQSQNINSGAFLGTIGADHMYTIPSVRPLSLEDPQKPEKSRQDNSDGGSSVGKLFACGLCEGLFVTPLRLKKHMLTHKGAQLITQKSTHLGRSHTCEICQKQFRSQHRLNVHKQRHVVNKPFSCVVCQKKFRSESDLKRHQLKHIGEKSLICWLCKETFTSPGSLKRHRLLHMSEHIFCPHLYRKKFTGERQVKKRKPVHTGGKLFSKSPKKRITAEHRYSITLDGAGSRDRTTNQNTQTSEVRGDKTQPKLTGYGRINSGKEHNPNNTVLAETSRDGGLDPQYQASLTMTTTSEMQGDTTGPEASQLCAFSMTEVEQSDSNNLETTSEEVSSQSITSPQMSVSMTVTSEIQGDKTGTQVSNPYAIPSTKGEKSDNNSLGICLEKIKTDHVYNIGLCAVQPISNDDTDNDPNLSDGVLSDKGQLKRHREFGGNTDTELNLQDTASVERRKDGLGPVCQTSVSMTTASGIQEETTGAQASDLCAVPMTEVEQSESNNFETTSEDDVSSQSIMSPQTSVAVAITPEVQDGTIGSEASRLCTVPLTEVEQSENDNSETTSKDVLSSQRVTSPQTSVTMTTTPDIQGDTIGPEDSPLCTVPMTEVEQSENDNSETTSEDVLSSQRVTSPQTSITMTATSGIQGDKTGTQGLDPCAIPMAGDEEGENNNPKTSNEDNLNSQSITSPQTSVTMAITSEMQGDTTLELSANPMNQAVRRENFNSVVFLGTMRRDHMYTIPSVRTVSRGDPVSRDDPVSRGDPASRDDPVSRDVPQKSVGQSRQYNGDGGTSVGKLFACELCEGFFFTHLQLKKHMLTHEGRHLTIQKLTHHTTCKTSHICDICQKEFPSQHRLDVHKQRHVVKKPFSCVVCQKRFRIESDMRRHQLKHIGEKSLICWLCKETFTSPGSLKRHRLLHMSEHIFCPQLYRKKVTSTRLALGKKQKPMR